METWTIHITNDDTKLWHAKQKEGAYIVLGAVPEAGVAAPRHAVAGRQLAGALALEEDDGLGERVGVVERRSQARSKEQQVEYSDNQAQAAAAALWLHCSAKWGADQ